jgi:predicted O-methyltransferase YrrM
MHEGTTNDILPVLLSDIVQKKREKYDFIYIDGSHFARDVLFDAVLGFEMLKDNGLLVFDDYKWKVHPDVIAGRPKTAIDSFLACYSHHVKVLHQKYQVHLQKLSQQTWESTSYISGDDGKDSARARSTILF